jgi:5'-nucleotidase (lipoprotein e(P4) family)
MKNNELLKGLRGHLLGVLCSLLWFWGGGLQAQNPKSESELESMGLADLRDGDLIFQELNCGLDCAAIAGVTRSAYGRRLTHCGFFFRDPSGTLRVVEAVGRGVVQTELQDFLARTSEWRRGRVLVGRSTANPMALKAAVDFALARLGQPYDEVFEIGNERWYCSELIDAALAHGSGTKESYFGLNPMTFKASKEKEVLPFWQQYFDSLGVPVPEGKPGINPGGMSLSPRLRLALLSSDPIPGTMDAMLLSTLYVQRSAEYRALCLQTYRSAAQQLPSLLDSAIRNLGPTALAQRPAAIVLDLDETVLDNSLYAGWQIRHGAAYSSPSWQTWVDKAQAEAVPGVRDYLETARRLGLQILYLSNRKRSQWAATESNLKNLGLPVEGLDSMLLRQEGHDKQARRDAVTAKATVLQWVGDNLQDMNNFQTFTSEEERQQALDRQVNRLGRDWILLPNPVYGPWEDLWHTPSEPVAAGDIPFANEAGPSVEATSPLRKERLLQRLRFFRP